MLNVALYPIFKYIYLFREWMRLRSKNKEFSERKGRKEVMGEINGYVWKWFSTSAPGESTNPSGDWLQEERVSVQHSHAYSILFLHKSWSVTSTRLLLGVEVCGDTETAHSTWVIHCCYFYTLRLVNPICRDTPVQLESTGHSHSICPSLDALMFSKTVNTEWVSSHFSK